MKWICANCGVEQGELHTKGCEYYIGKQIVSEIVQKKGLDPDKLRLNLGGGNVRYSNCLNLELEPNKYVDGDIYGNITKGLPYIQDNTFHEVLFIHVVEHIERKYHARVFDEIWRILKPGCRLVMAYPDVIECMKRFIDNKFGGRDKTYHFTVFGRQLYKGDYHISGIWKEYIIDRLFDAGFVDVKYLQQTINATLTARKGDKLPTYI